MAMIILNVAAATFDRHRAIESLDLNEESDQNSLANYFNIFKVIFMENFKHSRGLCFKLGARWSRKDHGLRGSL